MLNLRLYPKKIMNQNNCCDFKISILVCNVMIQMYTCTYPYSEDQ